jgi:hypothetical protein
VVDLVGELHQKGIQFKSLTDAIDTSTASGRFFFHVMASGPVLASKSLASAAGKAAANGG